MTVEGQVPCKEGNAVLAASAGKHHVWLHKGCSQHLHLHEQDRTSNKRHASNHADRTVYRLRSKLHCKNEYLPHQWRRHGLLLLLGADPWPDVTHKIVIICLLLGSQQTLLLLHQATLCNQSVTICWILIILQIQGFCDNLFEHKQLCDVTQSMTRT